MGHEVRTLGFIEHRKQLSSRRRAANILRNAIIGDRPGELDKKTLRVAGEFKPDLILALTAALHSETLQKLGTIARGGRILWWGDPPANSQRWGIVDPGWDSIYIKDHAAVGKLRMIGRNAHLLHEAMNPDWHKPVASSRNGDVVIVVITMRFGRLWRSGFWRTRFPCSFTVSRLPPGLMIGSDNYIPGGTSFGPKRAGFSAKRWPASIALAWRKATL